MSLLLFLILIGVILFAFVYGLKRIWPHLPILPGLFEDMANGYSYDEKGQRLDRDS